MGRTRKIARRTFLIGSAAVAGGVVFGYWKYRQPYDNPLLRDIAPGAAALTPYVRIDQGGITIITPRAEMGQGVHTTLAAMVAEELDVSIEKIRTEHGPAAKAYYNAVALEEGVPFPATDHSRLAEGVRSFTRVPSKFMAMQMTGGSSSTPDGFVKMRKAGAAARIALLQSAADQTGIDVSSLATSDGHVLTPDGSRLPYTDLASAAAKVELPDDPPLKPQAEWKVLGKSQPRVDMVSKCTGTAEFAIDVRLPGIRHATVKMNPHLGAPMNGFDAARAESMPGIDKIVSFDGGVAVIASNTWYAMKAANAIKFDWADAPYPATTAEHFSVVAAAFDEDHNSRFRDDGDVDEILIEGGDIEVEYRAPYLAHATMEPMNAVAWLRDGRLDVWAGNQFPTQALKDSAEITGIEQEAIRIHTTYMGGGFGRRAEMDFIKAAVHTAKALEGTPVSVTWSREEDMTHDNYRPLAMARVKAKLEDGEPVALSLDIAAPSIVESQFGRVGISIPGPDISIVQSTWDQPYRIPNYRATGYKAPVMLPVSSWRSVGASQNGFFHESAIDEIATAAGADPLDFRLSLITDETSRKVLEAVADLSGWGSPLLSNRARGVAFVLAFGVPTAEVIEVEVTASGIRIVNAYAAVDVGIALDPRNIEAQVQSGINFGLAAAMMGEITVMNGMIQQTNFHNYDAIRMSQAPEIKVRVLENGEKIRGIGEPGTPPAAPALANAVFAATGKRIRELPLNKHVQFA